MLDFMKTYIKRMELNSNLTLGQIRKNQSDLAMDLTFRNDPNYKSILIGDGINEWKVEEIKFNMHSDESIVKDKQDYLIQFKTKIHYPIGSYVIIPDDTSVNPDINNDSNWWVIVGRNNNPQFVQYNVLQCNKIFKWIYKNEIYSIRGCIRDANNYNSGVWTDDLSTSAEDMRQAWIPNNEISQTLNYGIRMILNKNPLHSQVFAITKIKDSTPFGAIKITFTQNVFNKEKDNLELGVCDFYDINKESVIENNTSIIETNIYKQTENIIGESFSFVTKDNNTEWTVISEYKDNLSIYENRNKLIIKLNSNILYNSIITVIAKTKFGEETINWKVGENIV